MEKYPKISVGISVILRILVSTILSFIFFTGGLTLTKWCIPDTGPIELAMLVVGILLFGVGLFTKSIIGSACFFIASIPFWLAATASTILRYSESSDIIMLILVILLVGLLVVGLVINSITTVKEYCQQISASRVLTYTGLILQLALVTAMVLPYSLNPQYWGQFP